MSKSFCSNGWPYRPNLQSKHQCLNAKNISTRLSCSVNAAKTSRAGKSLEQRVLSYGVLFEQHICNFPRLTPMICEH